jgi:hypothetical protein
MTARWPVIPGESGTAYSTSKEIFFVDGVLETRINGKPADALNLTLPQEWYTTKVDGITSILDTALPSLSIRLTDTAKAPLTSLVTITTENGLIQPCSITSKTQAWATWPATTKQCTAISSATITNGVLDLKLLPTMKAGKDAILINIPGLETRRIPIKINAWTAYRVNVIQTETSTDHAIDARFVVQDIRGNTITTPTQVQYTLLGDLSDPQGKTAWSAATTATGTTIRFSYGTRGGKWYIYGELQNNPSQQPWYLQTNAPAIIWPKDNLNVVYMTLDGKDWGNPLSTTPAVMMQSSSKLLAVSTLLYDPEHTYPTMALIDATGTPITSTDGINDNLVLQTGEQVTHITIGTNPVWYVPHGSTRRPENIIITNPAYKAIPSWSAWSSNKKATAIVSLTASPLKDDTTFDFTALRSYAGGATLGESRKHIFSPESITYGDPFLQHKDAFKPSSEQTTVTLFQDDTKTIKKTMELDIDADGKRDLVVLYDDDTMRFLKNYGGTNPYRQIGNLMSIVDGVSEMRIGDADGNGLQDIFIKTKKNTLRVYLNKEWSFDVNGQPICIDVPAGEKSLSNVYQLFIEDMNRDGRADIITNDTKWRIRIFYGGWNKWEAYYVSSSAFSCDGGRSSRQKDHTLTVATFWLNLIPNTPVYDDSLIHWKWLTLLNEDQDDDVEIDDNASTIQLPAGLQNAIPTPENPIAIDINALVSAGLQDAVRYMTTPYDKAPAYETSNIQNMAYIPQRYLTGSDIVRSYKTFAYGPNDTIIATTHIVSTQNTQATYIDQLRGPWEIPMDEDGNITDFSRGNLNADATIDFHIGNGYQFVLDNINLQAGKEITFSYPVTYKATQLITIDVLDTTADGWLDITVTPIDACMPYKYTYVSQAGVSYTPQKFEDPNTTQAQYASGENELTTMLKNIKQTINDAKNKKLTEIPGLRDALEQWDFSGKVLDNIVGWWLSSFNLNASIDTSLPGVEQKIDSVLKWLCNGFGGWAGGNLPVPFNVAFLAPGTINVMWCKVANDKWLPVFHFPGTLTTPVWPVPIPRGMKWPGDGFYRAPGWTYPSQIRIYAAPTLTLSAGFALCFWPYAAGIKLPSPLRHIAGNCITFGIKPGKKNKTPKPAWYNPADPISAFPTAGPNSCRTVIQQPGKPISPLGFTMNIGDKNWDIAGTPQAQSYSPQSQGIVGGTYLGIIDIDTVPYATQKAQENIDAAQLKGGKPIKLQIEWGNVKGLVKCVIQKWLDNQIRYLINNLTNLSINLTLPDVTNLTDWFKNLNFTDLKSVTATYTDKGKNGKTEAGTILKNLTTKTKWEEFLPVWKSDVSDLSALTSNPIDAIADWFESVPLIHVSTRNVNIQVPFIYNEELKRYTAQMEDFGKQAGTTVKEWETLGKTLWTLCNTEKDTSDKEACKAQAGEYINISVKTAQLQRSIKQNLVTLQAYKKFPLEIQKWLTVSQRYMSEATDTVKWVSTDITSWMNINARRFEGYTDAIILMVSAIKSWQAIIDFSVNWKSKCGQCTVDNYDYYSCALKLLCPKLPILKIPPFKIPNIYIDLSKIRLGMDVVLPKIQFSPRSLPLPALPELPHPPQININMTAGFRSQSGKFALGSKNIVPSIPQLPAPPQLPELPSVIPSIELNLPTLPPAPRVPRLAPAISSTLKVAGTIAKILCIVKNGIWLVGEKWVKTRIEQQTQRRRDVQPFDSLSLTKITPPLRGFDIKVETTVDFEINFDQLYTMLDNITSALNKKTNTKMQEFGKSVSEISSAYRDLSENAQNAVDTLGQSQGTENLGNAPDASAATASYNIDESITTKSSTINISHPQSSSAVPTPNTIQKPSSKPTQGTTKLLPSKQTPKLPYNDDTTSPDVLRKALTDEIITFKHSEVGALYQPEIAQIEWLLATPPTITPTYNSVYNATNTLKWMITQTSRDLEAHKQSLNNYDTFLDATQASALIDNKTIDGDIYAQLFAPSPEVSAILTNTEHPMRSYLNLQKRLVDGFTNALETRGATNLNMGQFSYNKLLTFFRSTQDKIAQVNTLIPAEKNRSTFTAKETTAITNTTDAPIRPTQKPEKKAGTLTSDFFTTTIPATPASAYQTKTSTATAGTSLIPTAHAAIEQAYPTTKLGAIWWDEHRVMTNQVTAVAAARSKDRYNRFYLFDTIHKYGQLSEKVDDRGYISKFNSAFYIFNIATPIVSYNADGQSNKTVTVRWKNTGQPVYLIKLTKHIQAMHENFSAKDSDRTYVLAYASGYTLDEALLDLPDESRKKIAELSPNIISHQIVFDSAENDLTVSISLDGDLWSYTSILPAQITTDGGKQNIRPVAARSAIETLGVQRRWDSSPPRATVRVVDRKSQSIIAEWNTISLPRKWSYDLIVQWVDDGIIVSNTLQDKKSPLPMTSKTAEGRRENFPTTNNLNIYATATDQTNNIGNQNITITFTDPTITIDRVDQAFDERAIISNLSQLYPWGFVKFYSASNATVTALTGVIDKTLQWDFDTIDGTTYTTGWVFYDANTISLFAADKSRIARIEKASGRITLTPAREKRIQLILDVTQNTPRILVIDTSTKQTIFSLYLKSTKLISAIARSGTATVESMPSSTIWTFAWWQCVKDTNGTCVIFLTTDGDIYIPELQTSRVGWVYTYDNWVTYTMTIDGNAAVDIRFTPESIK